MEGLSYNSLSRIFDIYLNSSSKPRMDLISIGEPRDSQHSLIYIAFKLSYLRPSIIDSIYFDSIFPGRSENFIISRRSFIGYLGTGTALLNIGISKLTNSHP